MAKHGHPRIIKTRKISKNSSVYGMYVCTVCTCLYGECAVYGMYVCMCHGTWPSTNYKNAKNQQKFKCIWYVCMYVLHVPAYMENVRYMVCMYVCVMVRGRKLGGSKSTSGLHSRCCPATLM